MILYCNRSIKEITKDLGFESFYYARGYSNRKPVFPVAILGSETKTHSYLKVSDGLILAALRDW